MSAPSGALELLHPRLRASFSRIPDGHVGRGEGVFAVVGTPRRWLWPLLALLARDGVVLVSTAVTSRVGRLSVRLASWIAPRVTLVERFDDEVDRQRVSLVVTAPLVGTLYRYEGAFVCEVVPDDAAHDARRHP